MCVSLRATVVHNTAQNSSDNFPSHPPDTLPPESDPADEDHGQSRVDAGQRSACQTTAACRWRQQRQPAQSTVGVYDSWRCLAVRWWPQIQPLHTSPPTHTMTCFVKVSHHFQHRVNAEQSRAFSGNKQVLLCMSSTSTEAAWLQCLKFTFTTAWNRCQYTVPAHTLT